MTTGKHDHRTYGACAFYTHQDPMDFSAAVAKPYPVPLFRNAFVENTFLDAVIQVTEDLDTADAVVKIGKPGDDDAYGTITILSTATAGTILPIALTEADIALGEIVEVTYTQRAGGGEARVLANIGEALHER